MNHSQHPDTAATSPAYTSTIADGRNEILKELAKTDAVTHAVSVALLDDRRILWQEAFGLIDKTRNLPPNPETLFCMASLSKIVAAVGTMMLVDRGLVVLDEPVTRCYEAELPDSHDLPPGKPLSSKWQSRIGRRWLAANDAYSAFLALGRQPPLFSLVEVKGLANHIAAAVIGAGLETVQVLDPGESDSLARMCLKIPLDNGWGLSDLEIIERDGEEWVLWAGILCRPLTTVPLLDRPPATIRIGAEGLGEWRRLPAGSALTVSGARIWRLYDAEFSLSAWGLEEGEAGKVPNGAYLYVHGTTDSMINITLT